MAYPSCRLCTKISKANLPELDAENDSVVHVVGIESLMSISSSASNSAGSFLPTIVLIGVEDLWMQLDIGDRILSACSGLGISDFAVE